ncbi:MAG: hypothetical protein HRT35_20405 [Algicola sp.]|nr:hypothetical protein [Algicola sp.]
MSVVIALDGQAVPGKSTKLTMVSKISSSDASGTGSSTANVDTGFKPKKMAVSCLIAKVSADHLTTIVELSEKTDSKGDRHIYTIVNDMADAMKVQQVKFSGELRVSDHKKMLAWNVKFDLIEHRSVAERVEAAASVAPAVVQTSPGQTVTAPVQDEKLTDFEKRLQQIEDFIGGGT